VSLRLCLACLHAASHPLVRINVVPGPLRVSTQPSPQCTQLGTKPVSLYKKRVHLFFDYIYKVCLNFEAYWPHSEFNLTLYQQLPSSSHCLLWYFKLAVLGVLYLYFQQIEHPACGATCLPRSKQLHPDTIQMCSFQGLNQLSKLALLYRSIERARNWMNQPWTCCWSIRPSLSTTVQF
jgi:hypothetical protein